MNHEIEVSNLMFNKTSDEEIIFNKYDINVDLEEESSDEEKTVLKYSLDLTSNPKNSVINISGNTILSGEQSEIEEFLKQENEKTPEVVSLIYQELFPLMYIISKNMKIPSPAHTISQNNIRESIQQTEKQDEVNEKPLDTQPTEKTKEVNDTDQSEKELPEHEIKSNTESDVKEDQNNENKTK
jgi:methanogenic corrinoid protein MtbC1